jgi:uncharacterized protein YoxC
MMNLASGVALAGSLLTMLVTVIVLIRYLGQIGRYIGETATTQAAHGKQIEKLEAGARDQGRRIEELGEKLGNKISRLEGSFEYSRGHKT